jgi:hypothetical protein
LLDEFSLAYKAGTSAICSWLDEAGASGGLSVLVSVLKARLLGLGAVLALTRHYGEMPYRFFQPPGSLFSGENGRYHVNGSVREHRNFRPLHKLRLDFTGFTGSTSSIDSRFYRLPFARFIG